MESFLCAGLFDLQTTEVFLRDLDAPRERHNLTPRHPKTQGEHLDTMTNEPPPPTVSTSSSSSTHTERMIERQRASPPARSQTSRGPLPGPEFYVPSMGEDGSVIHTGARFNEDFINPRRFDHTSQPTSSLYAELGSAKTNTGSDTYPFVMPEKMLHTIKETINSSINEAMKKLQEDMNLIMQELFQKMVDRLKERGVDFEKELDQRFADLKADIQQSFGENVNKDDTDVRPKQDSGRNEGLLSPEDRRAGQPQTATDSLKDILVSTPSKDCSQSDVTNEIGRGKENPY